MRYSNDILDDIRARLNVSTIVGRRVNLTKKGREFVGLSPFNSEKTPSFTVNDHKGFYHCFSSSKHGDIFRFLMETEGISFGEAVERLANEAGVVLPVQSPEARQQEEKRQSLTEVMGKAADYFHKQLHLSKGAYALGYLSDRGIHPKTQELFQIGYGLESRSALKDFLAQMNIAERDMKATGLVIHGDDIAVSYDRFRNRLMFPIQDLRGKVIGFGGRALADNQPAKYLNSPETELFHKGHTLYNIHRARQAVFNGADLLVAEGYMDVIALHQAGFEGGVAPLGTALTEQQLSLLWRISQQPHICLDGDKAGQKAAFRVIDLAIEKITPEQTLSFVLMPEGQDPDDVIREKGSEGIRDLISQKISFFEMLVIKETQGHVFETPEQKASLEKRLKSHIQKIQDDTLKHHYMQAMKEKLNSMFGRAQNYFSPASRGKAAYGQKNNNRYNAQNPAASHQLLSSSLVSGKRPVISDVEAMLLYVPLLHPKILEDYMEEFADIEFESEQAGYIQSNLLNFVSSYPDNIENSSETLLNSQPIAMLQKMQQISKFPPFKFTLSDTMYSEALDGWKQLKSRYKKCHRLQIELQEAERNWNLEPNEETQMRLIEIKRQLNEASSPEI